MSDRFSPDTLAKLAKYDTPTICNVIELFDFCPRNRGYMDGRVHADFGHLPPMVGFASTACFRSDAPAGTGDAYGSMSGKWRRLKSYPARRWSSFKTSTTHRWRPPLAK